MKDCKQSDHQDYTFQSEGTESIGWVAFKKTEDGFIRGYGKVDPQTETQSIDPNNLTFDSSVVYKISTDKIINSVTFGCVFLYSVTRCISFSDLGWRLSQFANLPLTIISLSVIA